MKKTACLALCCLLLISCSRAPESDSAAPGEKGKPDKVIVGIVPYISCAQLQMALEHGYFAEQNLDVEFTEPTAGSDFIPMLAANQIDVYCGSFNAAVLNAIVRGSVMKIVADKGYVGEGDKCFSLVASKALVDSGRLDSPEGYKGLRVGRTPASTLEFFLDRVVTDAGASPDDLVLSPIQNMLQHDAILNGKLDLAVTGEPWLTRMLKTGKIVIFKSADEVLPNLQYSTLMYNKSLLIERRDVGRRFLIAYLKGVRKYNEGRTDENVALIARMTDLEPELIREMHWPMLRPDGSINKQSILDFQDWALNKGLCDKKLGEDEIWDLSLLQAANAALEDAQ